MKGIIMQSGSLTGTNADILTSTRLQTAPSDGVLLFQVQASDNVAANNYKMDLQLPDSDVPMILQNVPMGDVAGVAGQLSDEYMLQYATQINAGGRVVFGLTETGDAECEFRVTFTPNA